MSLVDRRTGEVAVDLTFDQALELTESIRESVADIEEKIVAAYLGRAWVALDYPSWDAYVKGEFKAAPLALPREERSWMVASLREQGLSLRAIGTATGTGVGTVARDLASVPNGTVDTPDLITGLDGRDRPAVRPTEVITPEEREERLRAQEHEAAVLRGVSALEAIVSCWPWLENLGTNSLRGDILARLTDEDRRQVESIRRRIGAIDE